jgi:3-hydroxyisobutyrate dehydrogenase-like beta-hydroxyacid dehydrogenase
MVLQLDSHHEACRERPVGNRHAGKLQRAMTGDYSPQFPLRLMNKDFGLILNLAAAVRVYARHPSGLRG